MRVLKVRNFVASLSVAGLSLIAAAPTASANTVNIIEWDTSSIWRVATAPGIDFFGYVGPFYPSGSTPGSTPGSDSVGEPSGPGTLDTTPTLEATGYGISPSNLTEEIGAFETITGLSVFSAVKDDNDDGSGAFRGNGSSTWGIITAKYFSLKGNGYTAFFRNDTADPANNPFRLDLFAAGSSTPTDALSHVTQYYVAAVPIPASLPLLAAGLGLIGWTGRRRRKAS